eukprot:TRINITY_DN519_c0_g2_i1.p1 TRINITY_DN519_c0_g2~~TRINITY_DN519_c0_g2_i1.p1  ORF type:complete len:388 (+),score=64.58 TRINITY_DN519_c0_g2_i1:50-1165(+)
MKDRIQNGVLQAPNEGISDILPLAECPELTKIDVSGNKLASLSFLSNTNVKTVKAGKNAITRIDAAMPSLIFLDVSENPLKELDIDGGSSPHLSALIAPRCESIADIPKCINNISTFKELGTLVLKGLNLSGQDLTPLCQLKTLKKLSLSNCELTIVPWGRKVHKLSNLTELRLSGNHLDTLGRFLSGCASLKVFDAGSNQLTETVLADIKDLRHLTHLTLQGNPFDSTVPENRTKILEACRGKLKYLDNTYATEDFKQRLEEKRERGNALRNPPKPSKIPNMLVAPDAVPVKRFKGNREHTVLINVIKPIHEDPELEEADAANMFTITKPANGSSSDSKDSGITRWTSNSSNTKKEDTALDFLLKRPKLE